MRTNTFYRLELSTEDKPERGPMGRFRKRMFYDEEGRRLVPIDLLEVERRLKARGNDGE